MIGLLISPDCASSGGGDLEDFLKENMVSFFTDVFDMLFLWELAYE